MFLTFIVIVAVIGFLVGFVLLAGYFAKQTKHHMQCIAFGDPRALRETEDELRRSNIPFKRTPNEIWVRRMDAERAKNLVEARFNIEITLNAILVFSRRHRAA